MTEHSEADTPPPRNRLADETSPYLLQHADNPVDWYPWGEAAFERARAEDKPLLLSVGYSSCHWCHVMAHESFEDETIAGLMNEAFVNVKVDREERPDVDNVYMTATQALTGSGGWPMTVFLTPEGKPFYAGTYFPPEDGHGRPGFPRVLTALRDLWRDDRSRVLDSAQDITERLQAAVARQYASDDGPADASAALTSQALETLWRSFDEEWGGFGSAPKFPNPGGIEFLLMHEARRRGEGGAPGTAGRMALSTLRAMAAGGMYDQLGGGFARYSVDRQWLVPHFEKMLYDNAQLARVYLHGYQFAAEPAFERIVRETLDYLEREMLDGEGGFHSAQDADSEGIEGKFFVWTRAELNAVLGEEDARICGAVYGVTEGGNFEDPHHPEFGRRNVLSRYRPLGEIARDFGLDEAELEARLGGWREALLAERERRVWPGLDDKVLTSWNGLALAAFAEAGRVLGDARYLEIARRNAEFVRASMWQAAADGSGGRLLHSWKDGVAKIDGLLDDYACYGLGLLELYRATGDLDHLHWAAELLEEIVERFRDAEGGGFFESPEDAERLILRQKPFFDAATPSGNGAAALLAFWLGRYFGRPGWEQLAREVVSQVSAKMTEGAGGFGSLLQLVELLVAPPREIAVVGEAEARAPFERELAGRFLPAALLAPAAGEGVLPVLEGRTVAPGEAAAYICEDFVCALPARSVAELVSQLDEGGA